MREIKVDHLVDCLEVYSSRHQVGANKNPNGAESKLLDDFIALFLLLVGVYNVHFQFVKLQLLKKLLGSIFRLHKDQHWRLEVILDLLSKS